MWARFPGNPREADPDGYGWLKVFDLKSCPQWRELVERPRMRGQPTFSRALGIARGSRAISMNGKTRVDRREALKRIEQLMANLGLAQVDILRAWERDQAELARIQAQRAAVVAEGKERIRRLMQMYGVSESDLLERASATGFAAQSELRVADVERMRHIETPQDRGDVPAEREESATKASEVRVAEQGVPLAHQVKPKRQPQLGDEDFVKYRHPKTGEVWNGLGKQPAWLYKALIDDGMYLRELIPEQAVA